ncbi:MAG TPA: hypothetical protein VMT74_04425 [Gaiellaceae bacterium]|nr:hypothetical protein [Gaiellaceae bacterium]
MEIGKPQRKYTIEPIRDPVPRRTREEPQRRKPPAPTPPSEPARRT